MGMLARLIITNNWQTSKMDPRFFYVLIIQLYEVVGKFTCKKVLPSSRNSRNGTSASMGFLKSFHPVVVKYCAPDIAHMGVLAPAIKKGEPINVCFAINWNN